MVELRALTDKSTAVKEDIDKRMESVERAGQEDLDESRVSDARKAKSPDHHDNENISTISKSLVRVHHEMFSVSNRIEEERRKAIRQERNRWDELTGRKRVLLKEEERLKRKEKDLKMNQ
ncbi:unnamed protein product [Heligmosomoides polygyrus]|uniref:Remorin_C domain-containing protein n=1 Tax=Heligmosomoides polygyrus TaxID=6339 RepID=A0A183GJP4_HELPZ|nr:unnamed protein product [Heligmosomoides polygyrus]